MNILIAITGVSIGLLTLQVLISLFNWLSAIRMEDAPPLETFQKVSLLIPVRNEINNVPRWCSFLSQVSSSSVEVIFLDDQSTDGTFEFLQEQLNRGAAFRLIQGADLPEGWVGKPWACHQLAQNAKGEVFLFCDADVAMGPQAISRTLSWMKVKSLDSVTALPFQEMKTWVELAVIPFVMHLSIFGWVPLRLIPILKRSSLAVANGQWFAISKSAYCAIGGHESVKNSVLEDMELGRKLVANGFSLLPILAVRDLKVRMYSNSASLGEGFTKNLFLLSGGRVWSAFLVELGMILSFLWPVVAFVTGLKSGALSFGLLLFFRSIVAISFSDPWSSVGLHLPGFFGVSTLLVRSTQAHLKKAVLWRGRKVPLVS